MRQSRSGYATLIDPMCPTQEWDTFTCAHCYPQRVVRITPFCDPADMGGLCKLCMGAICSRCVGGPCVPFEKKIDRYEARSAARRWMEEG